MKIICAGYWKTGTKSLARALRILGYKVYDYDDQLFELENLWTKFFDGSITDEEIRKSLEDVDVLIDGPVIAFWEEIHRAIPEAKVILTTRDEDSWWRSLKGMQSKMPTSFKVLFFAMQMTPSGRRCTDIITKFFTFALGIEKNPTLTFSDNPRLYKYKFRQHNSHVIRTMERKSSSFLIHRPGDGWEPLCDFIDKEVPSETPYPHLNKEGAHFDEEGGAQNRKFKRAMKEAVVVLIVSLCIFLYSLYLVMSRVSSFL